MSQSRFGLLWRYGVIALPLLAFVLIRVILKGQAFDVSYGADSADGSLPYLFRLVSPQTWPDIALRLALGGGVLWVGVVGWRRDAALRTMGVWYVGGVVIATLLLSSRIARVVGVLYPILIPGLLYILQTVESQARKFAE